MITLGTAECFTHGLIGTTVHKISSNYEEYRNSYYYTIINGNIKVLMSSFLPSRYAIEKLFNIKLPKEDYNYKYSKAYNEENDLKVSYLMAKGVKDLLNCNIGIGTTAGIGRGGITIITDYNVYQFTTDVYGDLIKGKNIIERQKNGIEKTLNKLMEILKEEYNL